LICAESSSDRKIADEYDAHVRWETLKYEPKVCFRAENNWNVHFIKAAKAESANEIKPREIPIIKDKKCWVMNNDFPSRKCLDVLINIDAQRLTVYTHYQPFKVSQS
jgi:hypothetical protein